MSPQLRRALIGIGGAAAILIALVWIEASLVNYLQSNQDADPALLAWQYNLAQLIEWAGLAAIVLLGVAFRGWAVSAAYIAAGAYLAFRWPLWVTFRMQGDIAVFGWQSDANRILEQAGYALVVTGLVALVLVVRERRARRPAPPA